MKAALEIPWKNYALIAHLSKEGRSRSPQLGKTALQKLVYLLQEIFEIDFGYSFKLYSYGPFTSQLLHDLDVVEHMGGVRVEVVLSATGGYRILPGERADSVIQRGQDELEAPETKEAISRLMDEFGGLTAKELELRSTIVYVDRAIKRPGQDRSAGSIIALVGEIKPKFTREQIEAALSDLRSRGYVLA